MHGNVGSALEVHRAARYMTFCVWKLYYRRFLGPEKQNFHLVATGDGWKTRTSMPRCRTSTARLAPNALKKDFVAAYSAVKGDAIAAAALDVNTMQPRCPLATCASASRNAPDRQNA